MSHQLAESVDDRSFSAHVLEPGRPALVLFTARDCVSCVILGRRLPELATELHGMIDVVCCPTEASPWVAHRYNVARTPTLLLFIDSRVIASRVGPAPLPVIRRWAADALKRALEVEAGQDASISGERDRMTATKVFIRQAISRPTILQACGVGSVVAPVLLLLNHADILLSHPLSYTVLRKLALNFVVPYLVSSYSSARAAIRGAATDPGAAL